MIYEGAYDCLIINLIISIINWRNLCQSKNVGAELLNHAKVETI